MKLIDNNTEFELEIKGYEFPFETNKDDANWLNIYVSVTTAKVKWQIIDPCLITSEVVQLIKWLKLVVEGTPEWLHISFLEPCLEFEVLEFNKDSIRLRINLSNDLRPPEEFSRIVEDDKFYSIELDLLKSDIANSIRELEKEFAPFPVRAEGVSDE